MFNTIKDFWPPVLTTGVICGAIIFFGILPSQRDLEASRERLAQQTKPVAVASTPNLSNVPGTPDYMIKKAVAHDAQWRSLLGKWSINDRRTIQVDSSGIRPGSPSSSSESETTTTMTLKSDGTGDVRMTFRGNPGPLKFTWSVQGKTLTLTGEGAPSMSQQTETDKQFSSDTREAMTDRYEFQVSPDGTSLRLRFLNNHSGSEPISEGIASEGTWQKVASQ